MTTPSHSTVLHLTIPKSKRDEVRERAAEQGLSMAAWIRSAVYRALREAAA